MKAWGQLDLENQREVDRIKADGEAGNLIEGKKS